MNTLSFPIGAVNEYQYSVTNGSYNYVDDSANPEKNKKLIGEDVLIIYMDRDQVPFKFFPLRKGVLVDVELRNGRAYYYVKLDEYVYANSIDQFNEQLQNCVGNYLFNEIIDETGTNTQKGFFAFLHDEPNNSALIKSITAGRDNWLSVIKQIEGCKKFKEENNCVFTKFSLSRGNRVIAPTRKKKDWYYRLAPSKEYSAVIDCYFINKTMFESESKCDVRCILDADNNALHIRNKEQALGTPQKPISFTLFSTDLGINSVKQQFLSNNSDQPISYAQKPIPFKTRISSTRIVWILLLALVLFIADVISGLKTETIIPRYEELLTNGCLSNYQSVVLFFAKLTNRYCEIVPAVSAAVKTGCTAAIAWLIGKKK